MSTGAERSGRDPPPWLPRGGRKHEIMLAGAGFLLLLVGAVLWLAIGQPTADINTVLAGGLFAMTIAVSLRSFDLVLAHFGMRLDMRTRLARVDRKLADQRRRLQRLREREGGGEAGPEAEASGCEPGHYVPEGDDLDHLKSLMAMVGLHAVPLERVLAIARSVEDRGKRDRTLVILAEKLAETGKEEPARIVAGAIGDAVLRSRTLTRIAGQSPDTHRE